MPNPNNSPKPTLLLPPRYSDDSNALWRAAIALGWNIERLQGWRVGEAFVHSGELAIYGESLWANFVAEQLGLSLYEPPLDWLARLAPQFLGRRVGFCTLNEARALTFPLFVKPAGEKSFAAGVYNSAEDLPPDDDAQESVWCLTSDVVEWEVEYRFFIRDDQVQTGSSYWRGDSSTLVDGVYQSPPEEMAAARAFVARLLEKQGKKGRGFKGFGAVIDVGIIRGVGWAVVEANPAFGAGIYGSDAAKVLEVVSACPFAWRGAPPTPFFTLCGVQCPAACGVLKWLDGSVELKS